MGAVDLIPIYPLGEEVGVEDCAKEAQGKMSVVVCVCSLAFQVLLVYSIYGVFLHIVVICNAMSVVL